MKQLQAQIQKLLKSTSLKHVYTQTYCTLRPTTHDFKNSTIAVFML